MKDWVCMKRAFCTIDGTTIHLLRCSYMLALIYAELVHLRHILPQILTLFDPMDLIYANSALHECQVPTAMLRIRIHMLRQDQTALTLSAT